MVRITVFGHSFARRQAEDPRLPAKHHPGLEYKYVAQGGLRWQQILKCSKFWVNEILRTNPHIIVIIMGTNDLVRPNMTPELCMDFLKLFLQALRRQMGTSIPVLLVPCTKRTTDCVFRPGQIALNEFNARVEQYNALCQELAESSWSVHFIKWTYKNRWNRFCRDGVHLSPIGQADLFFCIQRHIMKLLPREGPLPPKPKLWGGAVPSRSIS